MSTTTESIVKSLDSPDEVRPFAGHGSIAVVQVGDTTVGRGTFEPGWRWSSDVQPIAGTDSCQAHHTLAIISGRMAIAPNDGAEYEIGPGDVAEIRRLARCLGGRRRGLCRHRLTGVARYAKPA